MIQGHVDADLQAKIPIAVVGKSGKRSTLEAVVDTGFSGDLCISIFAKDKIALAFSHVEKFELGDGSAPDQYVYVGQLIFDEQALGVDVLVSKSRDTLIGAALLANKKFEVDYPNKTVRIRNSRKKK